MSDRITSERIRTARGIALTLLAAASLALALRLFVVEAYHVPSSSMEKTLLPGDYLFVNKLAYRIAALGSLPWMSNVVAGGLRPIRRGDVVVFAADGLRDPEGRTVPGPLVKRVVALPGDTVDVLGTIIEVNGSVMHIPGRPGPMKEGQGNARSERSVVPRRGDVILRRDVGRQQWQSFLLQEALDADGESPVRSEDRDRLTLDNDYYFMVGDNMAESSDSRSWGPVAGRNVIGEALLVYWSVAPGAGSGTGEHERSAVRWNRIGTVIR